MPFIFIVIGILAITFPGWNGQEKIKRSMDIFIRVPTLFIGGAYTKMPQIRGGKICLINKAQGDHHYKRSWKAKTMKKKIKDITLEKKNKKIKPRHTKK